jgi:hypothetical protein
MARYKIIDTNGREQGPFSAEEICEQIESARSDALTKVQVEGGDEWRRLGELREFAALLTGLPSIPRPADLLPILRVFPAFEYTATEGLQDVLAVYPSEIVWFQKRKWTEIPVEAGELDGLGFLLSVKSVGVKTRVQVRSIEYARLSKFASRGGRLTGSHTQGRELRFGFAGKETIFFLPDLESERIAQVLSSLLGQRFQEEAEFERARVKGRFYWLGLILPLILWPLVYAITVLPIAGSQPLDRLAFLIPFLFLLLVSGRCAGILKSWHVTCLRYHDGSKPKHSNEKRGTPSLGLKPWFNQPLSLLCKTIGIALLVLQVLLGSTPTKPAASLLHGTATLDEEELIEDLDRSARRFVIRVVFTSGLPLVPGIALIYLGYRLGLRPASYTLAKDGRPPVLYLRAFKDDGMRDFNPKGWIAELLGLQPLSFFKFLGPFANSNPVRLLRLLRAKSADTAEEQMAGFFRRFGPVIAIGRPGERLVHGGAQRIYATEETWRQEVRRLLAVAQTVVLQPAETEGVWWEIAEALKIISPAKVLLCLLNYQNSGHDYDLFRERFCRATGVRLPRYAGGRAFLFFDENWRPRLLPLRLAWPILWPFKGCAADFSRTLRPWLAYRVGRILPICNKQSEHLWAINAVVAVAVWSATIVIIYGALTVGVKLASAEIRDRRTIAQALADSSGRPATEQSLGNRHSLALSPMWSKKSVSPQWPSTKAFRLGSVADFYVTIEPATAVAGQLLSTVTLSDLTLRWTSKAIHGQVEMESKHWVERDGQWWLETIFVFAVNGAKLKFIQQVCAAEGKYCELLVDTKRSNFERCEPLLRQALHGFHLRPQVEPTPDGQIIYHGGRLDYSIGLCNAWRQVPAREEFDLEFEIGTTCVFGIIAGNLNSTVGVTNSENFAELLVHNLRQTSGGRVTELLREKRRISGREWLVLRLGWTKGMIPVISTAAMRVERGKAYQLHGWTIAPQFDNSEIEKAMAGFSFD